MAQLIDFLKRGSPVVSGVNTVDKYIQDPTNPYASIPNPNYVSSVAGTTTKTNVPIVPQTVNTGETGNTGAGVKTGAGVDTSQFDNNDPVRKFNLAIWDLLREAQGLSGGNEGLYSQQTALRRAAIGRQSDITPEELRVLSPSQQAAIRGANVGALQPEIDAISAKIKSQNDKLLSFENILGTVRDIGLDLVKITPSQEVVDGYVKMIEAGGSPSAVPEEVRGNVLSKVDWNAVASATASAEKLDTQVIESGGRKLLINAQTGETIKDLGVVGTDQNRIDEVKKFIDQNRGKDNLISADTYIEAQQRWIGLGGSIADFKAAFPPESVMGSWELPKLSSSIWKEDNSIQNPFK